MSLSDPNKICAFPELSTVTLSACEPDTTVIANEVLRVVAAENLTEAASATFAKSMVSTSPATGAYLSIALFAPRTVCFIFFIITIVLTSVLRLENRRNS